MGLFEPKIIMKENYFRNINKNRCILCFAQMLENILDVVDKYKNIFIFYF